MVWACPGPHGVCAQHLRCSLLLWVVMPNPHSQTTTMQEHLSRWMVLSNLSARKRKPPKPTEDGGSSQESSHARLTQFHQPLCELQQKIFVTCGTCFRCHKESLDDEWHHRKSKTG